MSERVSNCANCSKSSWILGPKRFSAAPYFLCVLRNLRVGHGGQLQRADFADRLDRKGYRPRYSAEAIRPCQLGDRIDAMLRCTTPVVALMRHHKASPSCLLLGVKRSCRKHRLRSGSDPNVWS